MHSGFLDFSRNLLNHHQRTIIVSLALSIGISPVISVSAGNPVPFVDTHAHVDFAGPRAITSIQDASRALVETMDRLHVEKTILMPLPQALDTERRPAFDYPSLAPILRQLPDRIRILAGVGILGSHYMLKPADSITDAERKWFKDKAEEIAKLPFVSGFGEFPIMHLSIPMMGDMHPYESVPADHPLLMVLADVAAENKLPIDVHFDLVPRKMRLPDYLENPDAWDPNPKVLKKNQAEFERLLDHNPETKFVWAHVGAEPLLTRTTSICRKLLKRHPNLYMSFRLQRGGPRDGFALDMDGRLKWSWAKLIKQFPDRFVVGSDTFYTDQQGGRGGNSEGLANLAHMLEQLPPDVARMVAHDNVYHIYRMNIEISSSNSKDRSAELMAKIGAEEEQDDARSTQKINSKK